jgi:hypothetical protein
MFFDQSLDPPSKLTVVPAFVMEEFVAFVALKLDGRQE